MFTNLELNGTLFTLFSWKSKWYFDLNNFCGAMKLADQFENLQSSLQDYEKSLRQTPRQKTWFLCSDFETIKQDINKSNKFKLENGLVINEDLEIFLSLIADQSVFMAVDFLFFCEYLQTMYQKWDSKKTAMSGAEFRKHLEKRCFFWLRILDSIDFLEPLINLYNSGSKPVQKDSAKETEDLLNYLQLYKCTNAEKKSLVTTVLEETTVSNEKTVQVVAQTKKTDQLIAKKRKRSVSARDRIAIAADQNWECFYCLCLLDECFEVDHIERFCESGNDHHSNLWALCASCHSKKDEWDRKRRKTNIWSDYRKLSEQEKSLRRDEILRKIQAL